MARVGRPPKPRLDEPLKFYGLDRLGYSDMPMTGDRLRDQLNIEFTCFRIAHATKEGGLGKFGHFQQGVNLLWNNPELDSPVKFVWNPWSDKMLRKACEWQELGVAGCTSAGKSGPFALWPLYNYIADPTHTLVLIMSTTLGGAKKRIWKTLREFWEAIPDLPGKALWSTNEILGPNYNGSGYGNSSGIYLIASEQSNEKEAVDKIIGIKAPRTGEPGAQFEELLRHPEYADLADHFDEDTLRDLIPRLVNLSEDRVGKLILIIDEATGCASSILNAINSNLKPANDGHFQVILLGNPNSHFDTFGIFCTPDEGWQSVTVNDEEWETATGGLCIRFNWEKNPRITEKNEKYHWMISKDAVEDMKHTYGRESLFYYRMCLGMWCPQGVDVGVYSEADIMVNGCMGQAIWSSQPPTKLSALDPSFSQGGDRSSCTFGEIGEDTRGMLVLQRTEEIRIETDPDVKKLPLSYQVVANWRKECEKRGILPENACCDITGALSFGDIIRSQWSPKVLLINSGGKAPKTAVGKDKGPDGKLVLNSERYANMATYIWYGAMPFLRSGQIKGITPDLAKQICSRQHDEGKSGSDGRALKIENKAVFKAREGQSPDESDSYFNLIQLARERHRFRPSDKAPVPGVEAATDKKNETWRQFCARARQRTAKRGFAKGKA